VVQCAGRIELEQSMTTESKSENPDKDLVVVGSSAGGVGALSTLVGTLPKNFPAPIVLAQHLDPQRPSQLGTILERRSTLPIVVVREDPPTPLENGKIYVVPSNRHVKISDGMVLLDEDHADRPKPSVDKLLSSAAQSYGENLIAVILTGAGSDGAAGAVDVKNAGGVVIVQNPQTAAYPSMPLSLPPTAVDHVVEMELIGPLLYDILKGIVLPTTEKVEDPLRELLTMVSAQTNIDFRNYKSSTIIRRIARRMAATHNVTLRDYEDYVRSRPNEVQELVRAFLIKVTGFFRDPEAFAFLQKEIIPQLIEKGKANGRSVRLWSAGCATGEEAYSLALLVADHLGPDFPEWNVKIFATDIAADAINFARRGLYPENVLDELPSHYRDRFFERIDHGYRITKALRQAVIFGQQDISRGAPFPRIDLVACRNLLIYLKPERQQMVLDLFAFSLQQSCGFLFLGKAETARPTKAIFELVNKKWKMYRCLGGPAAFPLQEGIQARNLSQPPRRSQFAVTPNPSSLELTQAEIEIAQLRRVNETMLRYTTVAFVIIDRAYRILTINAAARRLFTIRDLAYDLDFLHTVKGIPYQEVRSAIDTGFREHSTITMQEIELDPAAEGSGRYVNLTVMNMHVEAGAPELAIITATDVTEQVQLKRKLEAVQLEQAEVVQELNEVSRRYGTMNKELQDANEELQAANEELMLTQEELQATNEEFEATNEELQATNEELETNNEELQATNEELQTTNDELTARTMELQEFTRQNQETQYYLSAMLERFPHYVMILDKDTLTVETINPGYRETLGGREVVGLPLREVFSGPDLEQLLKLVRATADDRQAVTSPPMKAHVAEDSDAADTRFIHTIVPIMDLTTAEVNRLFIYSEKVR
jgi:two-component system, chemotaxis family, CheB/CheR fusion protein